MDKRVHLFVRRHTVGVAVQVIAQPHLCAFAADLATARADLAHVLGKLLARGELVDEELFFEDARLRKVDLTIRAVTRGRLLAVPMRFSVLTHGGGKKRAKSGPVQVLVPRLGLSAFLHDAADLAAYVEEMVRHHLYLAPLERLLEIAYVGEESLDDLVVSARPRERAEPKRREEPAAPRRELPPGLAEACRRLDDEAARGLLDRAFQRELEVARLAEIVGARARASALLVGEPSVGKTALVHELAARSLDERSPLAGLEVYSTSAGRIIAGMRYLGEWQARVERMLTDLRARRAVLHLESLAELCALGDDDRTDVARHLLPAVEAGDVALIVEATPEDVARAERTHGGFVQALRPLALAPLDPAAARAALAQAAARVARARKVKVGDDALERALDLTDRFGDGALPGGAVDLVRAAATAGRGEATVGAQPVVGAKEIIGTFCARTGYPAALVDAAARLDPDEVRRSFEGRVVGQPAVAELFTQLVVTLKTNLADPRRPLGSFLLLGPTGVGKTESALALAAYLFGDEKRLGRFDMAEYAAPGSAARLVAARGGESSLARRVREQPFGVVLLDEIEKADAGVHDLLLQILGEGRLTDGTGRTVSFRNTIMVLTSNLGADGAGRSLGFGGDGAASSDVHYRAAAAAFFRPELMNRFDQVVPYRPLSREVVTLLARRGVEQALSREGIAGRGVKVEWDDAVVARVAELGFEPKLGARPLKRAIERHVVAAVARLLVAGARAPKVVRVRVADGGEIVAEATREWTS